MHREVGAYDAKTKLSELLRDVERGDRITITVRGRAVAELGPPRHAGATARAVEAMRTFDPIRGIEAQSVADWIEEGRR